MSIPTSWPHVEGVRHCFVSVRGAQLHYVEAGRGEPLVMLHGWPQHWWSFRKIILPLSRHYRVICPDIRGLGWSESSARGYGFIELAADLLSLLDALGLGQVRLVGHDWGAGIGYTTCLQWPARVRQFVALGAVTPWTADGVPAALYRRVWHIWTLALFGRLALNALSLPARALRSWRHAGRFTPDELAVYLAPLRRPDAQRATARYYRNLVLHELPYFFRHFRTQRLCTPTLHLNGEHDPLTIGVPDSYQRYADDMRLELIPGAGHFLPEEQPELLVARMRSFFSPQRARAADAHGATA
jgi:pimeloyl-ACP methyl ester carboxylesterase